MTFNELIQEVRAIKGKDFPDTAVLEFPNVISKKAQKEILSSNKSIDEIADIFVDAIEQIDNGSVLKLETLILNRLNRRPFLIKIK